MKRNSNHIRIKTSSLPTRENQLDYNKRKLVGYSNFTFTVLKNHSYERNLTSLIKHNRIKIIIRSINLDKGLQTNELRFKTTN